MTVPDSKRSWLRALRHTLACGLCAVWVAATGPAHAQTRPKAASAPMGPPAPISLTGKTLEGRSVDLAQWQGKVVMVFYWNTGCVVCLEKMPELRANAAGWRTKPFVLVLVSTDRRRADVEAYMRTVQTVDPDTLKFPLLWAGDAGYRDTLRAHHERMPLTVVLDTRGRVVQREEGRMAPEAWDKVADLLP